MSPRSSDGGNDPDRRDARNGNESGDGNGAGGGNGNADGNGNGGGDERGNGNAPGTESEDRSSGGKPGGNGSESRDRPSTAEKVVMVVSVTFTVLLFAFAGWQMVTEPADTTPKATVIGTEPLENGSVAVTVRLANPEDVGLVSATVASNCTSPPTELQFTFMPAATERSGTLVCPPGTSDPSVSMLSWQRR